MNQLSFLPKATLNMRHAVPPEREAQELKEAESYDDYEEDRMFHPNSGQLEFPSEDKYHAFLKWLDDSLPLQVPTYYSTKAGATLVDALTRPEELQVGPMVATVASLNYGDSTIFEHGFLEAMSDDYDDDYSVTEGPDCIWKTISIMDGVSPLGPDLDVVSHMDDGEYKTYYAKYKDTVSMLVSNTMPAQKGTAILLSDLIRAALRKRRLEAFELLVPLMMTEKRPCTTPVGRVLRSSPIYEPRVFSVISAMLM